MRRTLKHAPAAGVALAGALVAASSAAAPCVATVVGAGVVDARGRARLVEQLGASLAQHDIAACRPGETPLAEVMFEVAAGGGGTLIRVRDVVTQKELVRVVASAKVPLDGRPLALAVAADELLRASWAEILLARAPAPPPEPPPQVRAVVEASLPAPAAPPPSAPPVPPPPVSMPERSPERAVVSPGRAPPAFYFGAALAGEHATGGLTLAGIDARFGYYPLPSGQWVSLFLRLGARVAPPVSSNDGSANAGALLAGAGGSIVLLPRGRVIGLELPVRVEVEEVEFIAHPAPGAQGSNGNGLGVSAWAGAMASVRLAGGWRLDVEAAVGIVLRPVDAEDGADALTALSGGMVGGGIGVRGEI